MKSFRSKGVRIFISHDNRVFLPLFSKEAFFRTDLNFRNFRFNILSDLSDLSGLCDLCFKFAMRFIQIGTL